MFEFLTLVLSASSICLFGFSLDSTILIVSGILISPLIVPLVDLTNGALTNNKKTFLNGLKMCSIGTTLAVTTGYVGGLIMGCFYINEWPNNNMLALTLTENLVIGLYVAMFSSFAFSIHNIGNTIKDSNTMPLLGASISASILLPAVNCGMLLAYSTLKNDSEYIGGSMISLGTALLNTAIIVLCSSGIIFLHNKRLDHKKRMTVINNDRGVPYGGNIDNINVIYTTNHTGPSNVNKYNYEQNYEIV